MGVTAISDRLYYSSRGVAGITKDPVSSIGLVLNKPGLFFALVKRCFRKGAGLWSRELFML